MKKYKVNVYYQSHISVEVEAENEEKAIVQATWKVDQMPVEDYYSTLRKNALYDETVALELN